MQAISNSLLNLFFHIFGYSSFPRDNRPTQAQSSLYNNQPIFTTKAKDEKNTITQHQYSNRFNSRTRLDKQIRKIASKMVDNPSIPPTTQKHHRGSCAAPGRGTRSPHGRGLGITFPFFPTIKLAQHTPRPLPCHDNPPPLSAPS